MAKVINGYKKKWGDRSDGRRAKMPGRQTIMGHLYPNRADCEVYLHDTVDITDLTAYIDEKNRRHPDVKTTLFHCITTAVARMIKERPVMNRFVQGRRCYERYEISMAFVAKLAFDDHAAEALMMFVPKDTDTIDDVSRLVVDKVREVRAKGTENRDGMDEMLDKFAKLPRPLLMLVMKVVKWMDFWGKSPKAVTEGNPNFATVFLSNLGSIKCPAVYHHLNNYGTNSLMITIGTIHDEEVLMPDGSKQIRKMVDIGATLDERIGDGFYFARSLKLVQYLCSHPELLDRPLGEPSGFDYQ